MMIRRAVLAAVLATACACGGQPARNVRDDQATLLHGSARVDRDGWIFVHLEGGPSRVGYQHGYLLANEIADLLRVAKPFFQHTTSRDWTFYRKAAQEMLWPKIDPEYQQEIDGIVTGVHAHGGSADRWDIVALNAIEELPGYYVPFLDRQQGKAASTHAPGNCSAFIATGTYTKDHGIVMGHNAWTDYVVGSRWNIVFDLLPDQGHRMLMDGLPGVIVSDDDFGVSSVGLMVTETTIADYEGFDPAGKPEFARARKALQYGASIDDFVRIMLDGNNGGYANDWLVGDNRRGEIALFELGLTEHSLRRTTDGYFVGSNFPVDEKLIRAETHFDTRNAKSSPNARHTRWEQLIAENKGRIDVDAAKRFESDRFDVIDKRDGPTERTLCGSVDRSARGIPEWDWGPYFPGGTVQAKVIDSAMADAMQFWGAIGRPCDTDFHAEGFLAAHPEYAWTRGLLRDLKTQPWSKFQSGVPSVK
jgi:hypothetical protein